MVLMRINLISYKELIIPTTATATSTKPIRFFIAYNNKIKNIYIFSDGEGKTWAADHKTSPDLITDV
jgi:hypothetical protein